MSTDKRPTPNAKTPVPATVSQPAPAVPAAPVKVPSLFRPIDWVALIITTLVLFISYYLTEAPNMTLEDSGELAVGSFYAGVPHPPGYPVWTIFTYFFANFLPFGSIAWRVGIASAVSSSLACGLLAFLVSRGSSMMVEGIEGLKGVSRSWENAICVVSGFTAGCLVGFNGFMWSQSVIVEVYPFSVLSLMGVLLCLLRWIHAPQQRRYLYLAFLIFGVCVTNHQTLLLIAMGIEVAVLAADSRLGRNLFLCNGLVYFGALLAPLMKSDGPGVMGSFNGNATLFTVFNVIGIGSLYIFLWYSIKGKLSTRAYILLGHFLLNVIFYAVWAHTLGDPVAQKDPNALPAAQKDFATAMLILNPIGILGLYVFFMVTGAAETIMEFKWVALRRDWLPPVIGLICWLLGAGLYLYMPITSATNPPMNWGYARTWDGFLHALSRGQYEGTHPSDVFQDPLRFFSQLQMMFQGVVDEFNWVYLLIAIVPFLFFFKMQKRERAWITGIAAIYMCLSVLLLILLNPTPDRQTQELQRVFFAASHVMIAMSVGYGLALIATFMAMHYQSFRKIGILGSIAAIDLALFSLIISSQDLLSNALDINAVTLNGLGKILCWLIIAGCYAFARTERFRLERPIILTVAAISAIASLALTIATVMGNKWNSAAFGDFFHTLAISFEPDQYALPIFAGLMLLGMTLLLLAALFLYRNRAPLALTLGLFAIMPLHSVMCHWFENEQRGHWFGYWFGHDMFTPPFGVYPEMSRNAILFGGTDPGRFAPTYMIFDESFTPVNCKPMDPKFDRRDVYIITQNALADGTYLNYIRAHYFRSSQNELHLDTPFFKEAVLNTVGAALGKDNGLVKGLANTAYSMLDVPVTRFGAKVEARRRAEGVYPPKEIYTPTPDDSQNSFSDYLQDAQQRLANNQLRPGEGVHIDNGRVSVSGQVAVMMINGLLCKVIFDHNPTNDFYVEESFPLEWMYPYETPSGVIMKINRQPLSSLPDDVFKKDHEFWSKYSDRLIGNWITYDTTVKEIAEFSDRVYLRHNFKGFKGDPKFVRDDDAQKAFSKLRSSIGGMFYWRISPQCPPEYRPKNEAEQQALIRETDFAFKQSFAYCPFSPEAVYRYVNFLLQYGRLDDAAIVAQTCYKLDPYNDQIKGLVDQMQKFKSEAGERSKAQNEVQQMETEAQKNPTNFQNIFRLASYYLQAQQTNRVVALFDGVIASPKVTAAEIGAVAQFYVQINNLPKLETTLEKYTTVLPDQPEPRYDLAALQAITGKTDESLKNLRLVLDMSAARLKTNSTSRDLLAEARKDWRFNTLRSSAEFQKLVPTN